MLCLWYSRNIPSTFLHPKCHPSSQTRVHMCTAAYLLPVLTAPPFACEPFLPCPVRMTSAQAIPVLLYTWGISLLLPLSFLALRCSLHAHPDTHLPSDAFPSSLLWQQLSYLRASTSFPASVIISEMLSTAGFSKPMVNCRELRVTQWQFQVFGV